MSSEKLFVYATNFAKRSESTGRGTQYPTFKQAARRMKCTYDELQDLIDDYQGEGYMGAVVGFRTGGGVATIKSRGDYQVEAYL